MGYAVESLDFSPPIPITVNSEHEELRVVAEAIAALASNNLAAYKETLADVGAVEHAFYSGRKWYLEDIGTTTPEATSIQNVAGIKVVAISGTSWRYSLIPTKLGMKIWNSGSGQPLELIRSSTGLMRLNPTAATPIQANGYTILDTKHSFDVSNKPTFKLYFKGWKPEWGRRVLEAGTFVPDESEASFTQHEHYELIRFVRDNWNIYNRINEGENILEDNAFKALAERMSWECRISLQFTASGGTAAESYRNAFGARAYWVRLLYIIDADPIFVVIWLPSVEPDINEDYAVKGIGLSRQIGFEHLFGIDVIQREGNSYMIHEIHSNAYSSLTSLFYWLPMQIALKEFLLEQY